MIFVVVIEIWKLLAEGKGFVIEIWKLFVVAIVVDGGRR